ncbi:MAG: hypothetical protein A3E82_05710 [Gammaproteobacteria bacterium RIFCSPHIGHO2_12_FULL_38_11]|nr:MAG: hypothetical protein A3E82_05710 [Gammaproteobacteria bacterium RIFCSPHIGHO2_12_FULL_38_11]
MNATLVPEPAPQQTSTYHAHEWFKKVNKAFQKWQAQKERFVLFKNIAHYQAFIDDILRDYESIPLDIMPSIMQSRLAVVDLLQLEIDYSDHLDYESAQQMKLITLCKTLLKSQSHRSERQQVAVDVLKKAEQIFLASHILPKEITADNFSVIKGEQHESSFNF